MSFRQEYQPEDGDLCARRLKEDRFEVSVYDEKRVEWRDQRSVSLAELNKFVRSQKFLGKSGDWEYYRPGAA